MSQRGSPTGNPTPPSPGAASPGAPQGLRPRQELAVRRFAQYCAGQWGHLLIHKVGTGKTITSMLIALNSFSPSELRDPNKKIFVVAPTSQIFKNFKSDLTTKVTNWAQYESKLVDYNYPELLEDLNNKNWRHNVQGSIVIFDEAHRMLGKEIYNSREAGSNVLKHPLIEDIFFLNKIKVAKKCIIMTGTPIQVDMGDICRLLNFVSQSEDFSVLKYAPANMKSTLMQYGATIGINFLKSKGFTVAASEVIAGTPGVLAAAPAAIQGAATSALGYASAAAATVAASPALMVGLAGVTALAAGYGAYRYFGSDVALSNANQRKQNEEIRKAERERHNRASQAFLSQFTQGGGIQTMKGGVVVAGVPIPTDSDSAIAFLKQIGLFTTGPASGSTPPSETAAKFLTESLISQFQEVVEELYNNHWNIDAIAKDGSKYISVYDPDIQKKLSIQSYNIGKLQPLVAPVQERLQKIKNKTWKNKAKDYATSALDAAKQVASKVTGSTPAVKQIESLLGAAAEATVVDTSEILDMPRKMYKEDYIAYSNEQLDLLRAMFSGEMPNEIRTILNIDKYDTKTPDVKAKYKFMRAYARMIGNFSKDFLRYYTAINADGTDYDVYDRTTGALVNVLDPKFRQQGGLFQCEKFKKCLLSLIDTRTTGRLIDPEAKYMKVQNPAANPVEALKGVVEIVDAPSGPANANPEVINTKVAKLPANEQGVLNDERDFIPHPHFKDGKQYLPLVYSYTEEYGLGPFCIYLKSLGFKYLLAHTKQAKSVLDEIIDRGKSKDTYPGFDPLTKQNAGKDPLCILIHPTMTEGYDFVYNPAIYVLEPCNTFGDQEQVYGRVLRSYSGDDVKEFKKNGKGQRRKLIYQFACTTANDRFYITKAKMLLLKSNWRTSRILPTPANLIQAAQRAKIESPDIFAIGRLKKEGVNLQEFEKKVEGGVDFSDMISSILCLAENPGISSCDPISGVTCTPEGASRPAAKSNVSNASSVGSDPRSVTPSPVASPVGPSKSALKRQKRKAAKERQAAQAEKEEEENEEEEEQRQLAVLAAQEQARRRASGRGGATRRRRR